VSYIRFEGARTFGVKRSLCVEAAPRDLITHPSDSVLAMLAAMIIVRGIRQSSQQNKANRLHAEKAVAQQTLLNL